MLYASIPFFVFCLHFFSLVVLPNLVIIGEIDQFNV